MKSHLLLGTALLASWVSASITLPRAWMTYHPDDSIKKEKFRGETRYLTWMADSQIKRGVAPTNAYTTSAFYSGVMLAYNRTGDAKIDYVNRQIDMLLYPAWDGSIVLYNGSNSIDDIRIGHSFLDIYEATGKDIYLQAAQLLKDQIDSSRRTAAGGFFHRYPDYVNQMWLDGIYMLDVFYARWASKFEHGNTTAWDDIANQYDLIDAGTTSHRATLGLPVHGFDFSKRAVWADPVTGAAPHVWSRAVGWYIMALVDTLDYFPASHPGRARLLRYLQSVADAVVAAQDPRTKGWWVVMTPGWEGKPGNYVESTGTSMFVYGLLKALRLGYIKGGRYKRSALQGYALMTETFVSEAEPHGGVDLDWAVQTGSLSSNGTFEYYVSIPIFQNDLKGVAPFMFAAFEYELQM
ncbi:uncharacterized protein L3040_008076 [Drepanopeziza brunnea f. sp. 'multigermtubi']|uniref:uncharacterized protein n=1 Tax=Drepanopeziza brunnea f. sp. 'multigermtubi' TaxID=698441 RepID=UPI00239C3FF5|nr:hypothetical protein L3040_008076 [Drepanopeziza brunnea f. sp. 'multigermtubi']